MQTIQQSERRRDGHSSVSWCDQHGLAGFPVSTLWCRLFLMGCWLWAGMRKSQGIMRVPAEDTDITVCLSSSHQWPLITLDAYVKPVALWRGQWHRMCTLVNQLVERMLTVGSWFPPHNGASVVVYLGTLLCDVLSVGFHISLRAHIYRSSTPGTNTSHSQHAAIL